MYTVTHTKRQSRRRTPVTAEPSVDVALLQLVQEALAQKRGGVYYQVQRVVDRIVICGVLQHVKGNQVDAANLLGISRTTLRAKLRRLGLVIEKEVQPARDIGHAAPLTPAGLTGDGEGVLSGGPVRSSVTA